jgi:hypothetical protein
MSVTSPTKPLSQGAIVQLWWDVVITLKDDRMFNYHFIADVGVVGPSNSIARALNHMVKEDYGNIAKVEVLRVEK